MVFTSAYIYRGRGGRQRKGHRRAHWVEQCAQIAWNLIQTEFTELFPTPQPFFAPYTYLQLRTYAQDRVFWQSLVSLPTRRELQSVPFTEEVKPSQACQLNAWQSKKEKSIKIICP